MDPSQQVQLGNEEGMNATNTSAVQPNKEKIDQSTQTEEEEEYFDISVSHKRLQSLTAEEKTRWVETMKLLQLDDATDSQRLFDRLEIRNMFYKTRPQKNTAMMSFGTPK
jgi:hypothetical protein